MSFATEMTAYGVRPIVLVEIAFPGGTRYFSNIPSRFPTQFYQGSLQNAGAIRRSMQKNLGLFEVSSIDIELADVDGALLQLAGSQVKGVAGTVKLGTQTLSLSEFEVVHEGKIDDFGAGEYSFRVLSRDRLFSMPDYPDTGYVDETNFPNALPAHKGLPLPVCYGTHSDTDTTDYKNRGAWPTLYVDNTSDAKKFLIASHAVKSIDQVYVWTPGAGSLLLVNSTDYTAYPAGTLAGQTMAYLQFTDAQFLGTGTPQGVVDAAGNLGVITVNVQGKEDVGNGTGNLITNPIDVLTDLLQNYLGNPATNSTMFAAAKSVCSTRSYVAVGGYAEATKTDEVLKLLCDSFQIRLFPDKNGQIGVDVYEPISPTDITTDVREQWEILKGSYSIDFASDIQGAEDAQIVNHCDYQYSYHWAKDHYRATAAETDAASIATYGAKKLTLQLPWTASAAVAAEIALRYVIAYRQPVAFVNCEVPLLGMNLELADAIMVTHGTGVQSGGYSARPFEVIEHVFDPSRMTVRLRARDIYNMSTGAYFLDDESLRVLANTGTAGVTNGVGTITIASGPASLITAGVQVDDIIRITSATNSGNLINAKVTYVGTDYVTVSNTTWTTETGMTYEILPSWLTAGTTQKKYGHLCDTTTNKFSDGVAGFKLF